MSLHKVAGKLSYQYRRQKKLAIFNEQLETYLKMPEAELRMEYIESKAKYELRKTIRTVASLVIIIMLVLFSWKDFYSIFSQLLSLDVSSNIDTYIITLVMISFMIILFLVAASIMIDLTNNLYKLSKHTLFLEEIKAIRQL